MNPRRVQPRKEESIPANRPRASGDRPQAEGRARRPNNGTLGPVPPRAGPRAARETTERQPGAASRQNEAKAPRREPRKPRLERKRGNRNTTQNERMGENKLTATKKVKKIQITTLHIARDLYDDGGESALWQALEDAGYEIDDMDDGYTNMSILEADSGDPVRYSHSPPELDRLLQSISCGEHITPVTILVNDEERTITLLENTVEEEEKTPLTALVPESYRPALERLARDRRETPEDAVLRAVKNMVLEETDHIPMPGKPDRTLCIMEKQHIHREKWDRAAPDRRCPECAKIQLQEKAAAE